MKRLKKILKNLRTAVVYKTGKAVKNFKVTSFSNTQEMLLESPHKIVPDATGFAGNFVSAPEYYFLNITGDFTASSGDVAPICNWSSIGGGEAGTSVRQLIDPVTKTAKVFLTAETDYNSIGNWETQAVIVSETNAGNGAARILNTALIDGTATGEANMITDATNKSTSENGGALRNHIQTHDVRGNAREHDIRLMVKNSSENGFAKFMQLTEHGINIIDTDVVRFSIPWNIGTYADDAEAANNSVTIGSLYFRTSGELVKRIN